MMQSILEYPLYRTDPVVRNVHIFIIIYAVVTGTRRELASMFAKRKYGIGAFVGKVVSSEKRLLQMVLASWSSISVYMKGCHTVII